MERESEGERERERKRAEVDKLFSRLLNRRGMKPDSSHYQDPGKIKSFSGKGFFRPRSPRYSWGAEREALHTNRARQRPRLAAAAPPGSYSPGAGQRQSRAAAAAPGRARAGGRRRGRVPLNWFVTSPIVIRVAMFEREKGAFWKDVMPSPLPRLLLQGYCAAWCEKCVWFLKNGALFVYSVFSLSLFFFPSPALSKLSVTFLNNYIVTSVINYSLDSSYLCFFFLKLWLSKGMSAPLCKESKQTFFKIKQLIPN